MEATMRTPMRLAVAVLLTVVGRSGAGEREDALALIEAGIKAHGGAAALEKTINSVRKGTGTLAVFGADQPFENELITSLPDRFRLTVETGTDKTRQRIVVGFTGDKGWQDTGASVGDLSPERVAELREEAHVLEVRTLVPLRKEGAYVLASLPDDKVNAAPSAGIRVGKKGYGDLKLYFDKNSGLLVKIARHGKEGGLEVDKDYLYSDFKVFDAVKVPIKETEMVNGKKFTELTYASFQWVSKPPEREFAKP
jgi:hypothetical protein